MPYLLLRFCLLGSFVGGGVFVATRDIAMSTGATPHAASTLMNLLGIPLWAVLTSFLSLPLGFVPATLAALLYWQVLARLTSKNPKAPARAAIGAIVGCAAAVIFSGSFFTVGSGLGGYPVAVNLLAWSAAGLVGGAVAAIATGSGTYLLLFSPKQAASGA
jgi:hypothetical protein